MDDPVFYHAPRRRVRVVDGAAAPADRRAILKLLGAGGIALPATYFLGGGPIREAWASPAAGSHVGALPASLSTEAGPGVILRDFTDPVLELKRLLREAGEIEHALLLQYTYAALSLKPLYESVAGYGAPEATDLLGVAIQEMQHLGAVNRLLVQLGAAPQLSPLEFPFEPEIYPFAFNLEPLSRRTLAKYVYCEAPAGFFAGQDPASSDGRLAASVLGMLEPRRRPNHVGSLYSAIIAVAGEVRGAADRALPDLAPWIDKMHAIKVQGEEDHFRFFKSLFLGSHPGFAGHGDVWSLPAAAPEYPSYPLPTNPTAYVGHEDQIADPATLALAWLGNLQYWTALMLLDQYFRHDAPPYRDLAVMHMMGPVLSIGRHLPTLGVGMPFDPPGLPFASGTDAAHGRRLILALLREGEAVAAAIGKYLPADYPSSVNRDTMAELRSIVTSDKRTAG